MPARELARLIERLHPKSSVRSLEEQAGAAPQTLQRWLKQSTSYNRLPEPRAIREVARVLDCRVADVVQAFNESLDDPLPLNQLPDDELTLLSRYRALPPTERGHLLAIAQTFAVHVDQDDDASDEGGGRPPSRGRRRLPRAVEG